MKMKVAWFISFLSVIVLGAELTVVEGKGMVLVGASVEGVSCTLLVDTGASHTTLDLGFVTNRLPTVSLQAVELVGRTNVDRLPQFAKVSKLTIGEETLATDGVMALDLGHLSAAVGQRVDGILGMNHLRMKPCVLSLRRKQLIWNPTEEERAGFHPVLTRERGTTFELIVKLPSGTIQPLLVDTGSTFTFLSKTLWPASEETAQIHAADVNAQADCRFTRGKPGELNCGKGFRLMVTPMLTDEPDRNQLGSDIFRTTDLLIDGRVLKLR